ncbi:hypothetical protein D3C78_1962760 [compost metagenome]
MPGIPLAEHYGLFAEAADEVGIALVGQERAVAEDLVEDIRLFDVVDMLAPPNEGGERKLAL